MCGETAFARRPVLEQLRSDGLDIFGKKALRRLAHRHDALLGSFAHHAQIPDLHVHLPKFQRH